MVFYGELVKPDENFLQVQHNLAQLYKLRPRVKRDTFSEIRYQKNLLIPVAFPQKTKPEAQGSPVGKLTKHCANHKRVEANKPKGGSENKTHIHPIEES